MAKCAVRLIPGCSSTCSFAGSSARLFVDGVKCDLWGEAYLNKSTCLIGAQSLKAHSTSSGCRGAGRGRRVVQYLQQELRASGRIAALSRCYFVALFDGDEGDCRVLSLISKTLRQTRG